MDQLSPAERAEVESHLLTFPELRIDLREIENAFEFFAKAASLSAPAGLKTKIMDALKDEFIPDTRSGGGGTWRLFAFFFGLGLVVLAYLFVQRNHQLRDSEQELAALRDTCQTTQQKLNDRLQLLQQLTLPGNKIIPFTATPGYVTTDLYFHHNAATKRNFIQVRSLPALTADQTFELWSIKTGQAPSRMDLFTSPTTGLVEVQYVEGTDVYAITIERAGGVDSPTMANLIGTVAVDGQ